MDKYHILSRHGAGSYAVVWKAKRKSDNKLVAIKQLKDTVTSWDEVKALAEVKYLGKLRNHPNVIRLEEVVKMHDKAFLVFNYCDGNMFQTMQAMLREGRSFSEPQIRWLIKEVLEGLAYAHEKGYMHRDIKPENILISATERRAKLCDFGQAKEVSFEGLFTPYVSTRWYRAPELILKATHYGPGADMWAVGVLMAELYSLRPLFAGQSESDMLFKIGSTLGAPSSWTEGHRLARNAGFRFPDVKPLGLASLIPAASPDAIEFLSALLRFDPARRPSAADALRHRFMAGPTEVVKPIIPAPRATDEAAAKAAAAKFEASLAEMSAGAPSGSDQGSRGRGRGHRNHTGAGSGAGSGRSAPGGGRHGRWGEEKTGGGGGVGNGDHSSDDEHGGGKHGEGKTDWHTSPAAAAVAAGRGKQFANTSSGRAAAANHAAYLAARSEKRNLGREFDAQTGPRRGSRGHQRPGIAAGVDDGGDGGYRGRFHHQPSPKAQPARFGRRARPSGGKDADDDGRYDGHSTAATSALQGPAVGSLGQRQRRGGGGRGGGMGGGYTPNNGSLSARASTQGRSDGDAFDVGGLDSPLSSVSGSPRVDGLADVGGATPMSSLLGRHGAATRATGATAAAPAPAAAAFGRRSNANGRRGYGRRRTDASDGRVTMDRLAPGGGDRDRGGGNSDILARIKNLGSSFEDVSYEFDDATLGSRGFR